MKRIIEISNDDFKRLKAAKESGRTSDLLFFLEETDFIQTVLDSAPVAPKPVKKECINCNHCVVEDSERNLGLCRCQANPKNEDVVPLNGCCEFFTPCASALAGVREVAADVKPEQCSAGLDELVKTMKDLTEAVTSLNKTISISHGEV